jgi:hypothetical protein
MIKTYCKEGAKDIGLVSIYHWPKVVPNKKDIEVWNIFMKNIYCRDRLVINYIT